MQFMITKGIAVTFRINATYENSNRWHWDIKGLRGKGVYCRLGTAENGCGLYLLMDSLDRWLESGEQILSPDTFEIPSGTEKAGANFLLAQALKSIGWGPQCDQRGDIIP